MNNKEVTTLRRRLDRARKNVAGIARAADAALDEIGALNAILDEMVSTNLWGDKVERPNGDARTERTPRKPVTEAQIRHMIESAIGEFISNIK